MPEITKIETGKKQEKKKDIKYKGLCTTCKNALHCTFPRNPNKPVLECDEFQGYEKEPVVKKKTTSHEITRVEDESGESKYKGLCKICDNRETCTFPKPEGGVWHCEEYK